MMYNLTVSEVFSPTSVDARSIAAFLAGQGLMLAATAVLCNLFHISPIVASFDQRSMRTAVFVAVPMIGNSVLHAAY